MVGYLVRNNLRGKRFVLAYGLKVRCSGKDMAVTEGLAPASAQGSRRLLTCFYLGGPGSRKMGFLAVKWLSHFISSGTPYHGVVLPTFRMSLVLSITLLLRRPHGHTQRCASLRTQASFNPNKLPVKISYHILFWGLQPSLDTWLVNA